MTVDAGAWLPLGLDGVRADHQHVDQPDGDADDHRAEDDAQEHRQGLAVPDQQQIDSEEFRIEGRSERQRKERGVHVNLAGFGILLIVARPELARHHPGWVSTRAHYGAATS